MSSRFRLRDLLLVLAIVGTAVGLLSASILRVRESSNRIGCQNNLRRIGLAFHAYSDSVGYFPNERRNRLAGASGSVFYDIATFLEIGNRGYDDEPLREYLCLARRGWDAGPKTDYGYGANSAFGTSVLAAPTHLTAETIEKADGLTFTLMLSHKGICPRNYDGSGPNDPSFKPSVNSQSSFSRDPLALYRDSDKLDMWQLIGSPHGDGAPSLFVDGHVEVLPYVGSDVLVNGVPLMAARWAYNDGNR